MVFVQFLISFFALFHLRSDWSQAKSAPADDGWNDDAKPASNGKYIFFSSFTWNRVIAAKWYKLHIFLEGWSNNTKKKDDDGWNDEPATKSSGIWISEIFSEIKKNCPPWIRLSDSAFIQLHWKDGMVVRKATMMVGEYAYFNFFFSTNSTQSIVFWFFTMKTMSVFVIDT